jgi:hypothetical protein
MLRYLGILLSANVYNNKVSAWEPFIEPTSIAITSRQSASLHDLSFDFSEKFDINISDRMLASFMDSYQSFTSALSAPSNFGQPELDLKGSRCVEVVYTVHAENDLEIPVKLSFTDRGRTYEIDIDRYSKSELPILDENSTLVLSLGSDWLPVKDICFSRTGSQSFWVLGNKAAIRHTSVRIFVEIADTGSSKVLLIHSDRQIQNHSPVTIDVSGFGKL